MNSYEGTKAQRIEYRDLKRRKELALHSLCETSAKLKRNYSCGCAFHMKNISAQEKILLQLAEEIS